MSETSELIAKQIMNGNINKKSWGDILYNVKSYGAVGDGVTDDTVAIQSAIDYAILVGGKAVFFPHGTYKVTALTGVSSVVLFGDNATFLGISDTITQLGKPTEFPTNYKPIYNVMEYGAKGDGVTDDTIAIQATITAAMNAGSSVYLPPGTYKTSSTLTIDNTSSAYFNDPKKIHFTGAGNCQTTIKYIGTGAALKLIGGKSGDLNSFMTYQQIKDMRLLGVYTTGTKGIEVDTCSFLHLKNVELQGFDTGFYSEDMDNSSFTKCIVHFNNYGIKMQEKNPRNPLTSTRPNNINFYDCHISGNLNWGGLFIGGCTVNFFGGDVQGNGLGGSDTDKWGLMFLDMAVQGAVACNLYGVFFESNIGVADLWLYTQTASPFGISPAVYNVNGCTFNRSQNTWLSQNNILVGFDATTFGQQKVIITSCGFKNFNDTYTTDVSRVHLKFSLDARSASNCYFKNNVQSNDVEAVTED